MSIKNNLIIEIKNKWFEIHNKLTEKFQYKTVENTSEINLNSLILTK